MPHIEHGDDTHTVSSDFSSYCHRVVGSVVDYEDTHTELDSEVDSASDGPQASDSASDGPQIASEDEGDDEDEAI